jgi:hypothetical protein
MALQEKEQAEVLWEMGVHLGERFDGEHKILLYQIDGFYVEVFYHGKIIESISRTHGLPSPQNSLNYTGYNYLNLNCHKI